ncbi:MAG: hypothetical protein CMJ81_15675 [Planctomycetaceae bacterium]|nr:hypothetical protein [Planctomycetaceae bacterium]
MIRFVVLLASISIGADQPETGEVARSTKKEALAWIWETPTCSPLPVVRNANWPRGELDYFVLSQLEEAGLHPTLPAAPHLWLRRVHFAITGLPPRAELVDEFSIDTSPAARERIIDRLLASPHFGEHWARHWMDSMRYAETRGHEADFQIPNAYQYRDYLIRAINADLPYDRFVREHIAGDLLTKPRSDPVRGFNESVLGTGWVFLGEEMEAPVDIRQDECDRSDNKLDVFGKTFLGLTVACARCHDHKFDTLSQQDYYGLAGFIASSSYRQVRFDSMEHNRQVARQLERLHDESVQRIGPTIMRSYATRAERLAETLLLMRGHLLGSGGPSSAAHDAVGSGPWFDLFCNAMFDEDHPFHLFSRLAFDRDCEDPAVLTQRIRALLTRWRTRSATSAELPPGARVIVDYSQPASQTWLTDGFTFGSGPVRVGDIVLSDDPGRPIGRVFHYGCARKDPLWDVLSLSAGTQEESSIIPASARSGRTLRTPTFIPGSGTLHYLVRGRVNVFACVDQHIMVQPPLHQGVFTSGGESDGDLHWISHDLRPYSGHRMHLEFAPDLKWPTHEVEILQVVEAATPPPTPLPPWGKLYESLSDQPARSLGELAQAYQRAFLEALEHVALNSGSENPPAAGHAGLVQWLSDHLNLLPRISESVDDQVSSIAAVHVARRDGLIKTIDCQSRTAVAWMDGTGVDLPVLDRGDYRSPLSLAPRRLPEAFEYAQVVTAPGSGRLELARQLVDSRNPLVARVIVNRVWHHLFSRGIVASVDNFGYLGDRPTHPELLDHLACRFVTDDRWSIKKLIRRMVLSSTFAMSSRTDDQRAEMIDPTNQLWHRMPVRRLEAEAIRDAVLAVSGRLDSALFGPPVMVHMTEFVVGRGRPRSGPLDGDGRRTIYSSVRRNFLSTLMRTFDLPVPFAGVGRRTTTNVPTQSLAMMNDKFIDEQAEVWARRTLREYRDGRFADRLSAVYRAAFARPPTAEETEACRTALGEMAHLHGASLTATEVWTDLCDALLQTSEFIYVR